MKGNKANIFSINPNGSVSCIDNTITEAVIPKYVKGIKVTHISDYAFCWYKALSSIAIPVGVTAIGNFAFADCPSLTSVTIPDGVTFIGWYVFADCLSLKSITIPNSVTFIGDYAFYRCSSLERMLIDKEKDSITLKHTDIPKNCKVYWRGEF